MTPLKKTLQLRPGDLIRIAQPEGFVLGRYSSRRRHPDFPVYVVRYELWSDSGPVRDAAPLEIAAGAENLWLWVGMTTDAKPVAKSVAQKRGLARTT